jgi:hypothetical protein
MRVVHRRDMLRYLGLSAAWPLVSDMKVREPDGSPTDATIIPFTLHGRSGKVAVTYGVTEDPVVSGFDVVPGVGANIAACRGYPTIEGVIESYEGSGYRELVGWVQIVTGKRYRTVDNSTAPAATDRSIDKFPSMMDIDIPFVSFGIFPKLFDAPCANLNGYARLQFVADSFLTTAPLRSRDEEIHRLLGIRWGYVEYEDPQRHPVSPIPVSVTGAEAWNEFVPFLRQKFPGWRFAMD